MTHPDPTAGAAYTSGVMRARADYYDPPTDPDQHTARRNRRPAQQEEDR